VLLRCALEPVEDRAGDPPGREGAEGHAAPGVEATRGLEQPDRAHLHVLLEGQRVVPARTVQARGDRAHQRQVQQHARILERRDAGAGAVRAGCAHA
jgi:hypothetical protein